MDSNKYCLKKKQLKPRQVNNLVLVYNIKYPIM